jgi:radical SAM superfamily enzyme YgiQ (UPF0313 family)
MTDAAPVALPESRQPPKDVRLTRATTLLLRRDGVFVPRTGPHREHALDLAGIHLVARLTREDAVPAASVVRPLAERYGVEPRALHVLLAFLRQRGLTADAPPAEPPASPASAHAGRDGGQLPLPDLPLPDDEAVVAGSPRLFRCVDGGFSLLDHWGDTMIHLTPDQLAAAGLLSSSATVGAAYAAHVEQAGEDAMDRDAFGALAQQLLAFGVLEREADCRSKAMEDAVNERALGKLQRAAAALEAQFAKEIAEEEARAEATGRRRVPVLPVTPLALPLSIGMLIAYARQYEGGRLEDTYHFLTAPFGEYEQRGALIDEGGIFLFSNYVWSHRTNLYESHRIKEQNPRCLTIHGGPDTPKYPGDVEAYFEANPFVDVVVHGEGEVTFAHLLDVLAGTVFDEHRDLSALREVEGISFRTPDGVVRTPDRDRLTDLDVLPSPYLSGVYDAFRDGAIDTAMIETNRGCPYSCTFCDWGSSTASRIRKFDLDRVLAELEWCAKAGVSRIFLCDANFGILERDVQIAEKVAELRQTYGFPQGFTTNYAKNTVKHLQKIVQIMAGAGVITEGLLSLQSMDDETLATIRRSNIKVEKYDALAAEFRESELPLMVDLMIGLPGSSPGSLREDFQQCIDREVYAKVFQTELLVNSPMNEPSYREEHQIRTESVDGQPAERVPTRAMAGSGRALVVSSSSFTRADYDQMLQLRAAFLLVEDFAVLRLVARFLRQRLGLRESDLLEALRSAAVDQPDRWPFLSIALRTASEHMVPPVSWKPFMDEIGAFATEVLGAPPGSDLDTVLMAQHLVLPAPGRSFPHQVDLAHDVGAWYRDILMAKDAGHRTTWPDHVEPVASRPPVTFTVDDPDGLCEIGMGFGIEIDPYANWELHSPVARTMAARQTIIS